MANSLIITNNGKIVPDGDPNDPGLNYTIQAGTYANGVFTPAGNPFTQLGGQCTGFALDAGQAYLVTAV